MQNRTEATNFVRLVRSTASKFGAGPGAITCVSVAPMQWTFCVPVRVPVTNLAAFLNDLGTATSQAQFLDVQVWLQQRGSKKKAARIKVSGVLVDVDQKVPDILETLELAGVPLPNAVWETLGGYKLAYVLPTDDEGIVDPAKAELFAKWVTLALQGGDPGSWDLAHAQHLPICIKWNDGQSLVIALPALQTNPRPVAFDPLAALPPRLRDAWGASGALTSNERAVVERFLEDRGISAPASPGKQRYSTCPVADGHSTQCCSVYRRDDGSIFAYCAGSHGGEGQKRWSEKELYRLAVGGGATEVPPVDAVKHLPATWAGAQYRAFRLHGEPEKRVEGAEELWRHVKATVERERWLRAAKAKAEAVDGALNEADLEQFLSVYRQRGLPYRDLGPINVVYDDLLHEPRILTPEGAGQAMRIGGDSLSPTAHAHEWRASQGFCVVVKTRKVKTGRTTRTIVEGAADYDKAFASNWNKALVGHHQALASLGLAVAHNHRFPIAFVTDERRVDPRTGVIVMTKIPELKDGDPSFDVVGFFVDLWRAGRLPLASENDVRKFVMCIASPLLREVAPGMMGIYWFVGPPGAGKDWLCELAAAILEHGLADCSCSSKFDISVTDDLEAKRSFYAAGPAVFGRAKEAGKRKIIEMLVRFAGTDRLPARGMRLDEIHIPNVFTYVADSAEDLPEQREISRRTVMIQLVTMDDEESKGAVHREILARAPDIIASLKRLVESKPREWYLEQSATDGRPLIPVALARLLGASLAPVEGRRMDDLFEAMLEYTGDEALNVGIDKQWDEAKRKKLKWGKPVEAFPFFPIAHFVDVMKTQPGHQNLFRELSSPRLVKMKLDVETDYPKVTQGSQEYLRVEIDGTPYAFLLVHDDRYFILQPELVYCNKLGIQPIGPPVTAPTTAPPVAAALAAADPGVAAAPPEAATTPPATAPVVERPASLTSAGDLTLSEEDLLKELSRGRG